MWHGRTVPHVGHAARQQAGNILRAWIRCDASSLRKEFKKGLELGWSSDAPGLEEERLELLRTVLTQLNDRLPTSEPADPMVRLCISLLMHLTAFKGQVETAALKVDRMGAVLPATTQSPTVAFTLQLTLVKALLLSLE